MKHIAFIIAFIIVFCISLYGNYATGQTDDMIRDTLLFRKYLCYDNIAKYVDIPNCIKIFRRLGNNNDSYTVTQPGFHPQYLDGYLNNFTYSSGPTQTSKFVTSDDIDFSMSYPPIYLEEYKRINADALQYLKTHKDIRQEKLKLVAAISAFDSLANHRPIFFVDIYGKYNGDIAKYVDDLYKTSIITRKRLMSQFVRTPRAKRLQKDMGIQFAIAMALYELWIKDIRDGHSTDTDTGISEEVNDAPPTR